MEKPNPANEFEQIVREENFLLDKTIRDKVSGQTYIFTSGECIGI
jgi:hypothetical protein